MTDQLLAVDTMIKMDQFSPVALTLTSSYLTEESEVFRVYDSLT